MDLRLRGLVASPAERAALDKLLGPDRASAGERHLLLPALHAVHDVTGWITPEALDEICYRLEVPPAEAYGVASFYGLFSLRERPPRVVHVCVDLACMTAGASELVSDLEGASSAGAAWVESPCLGVCERAPAALVTQYGERRSEAVLAPVGAEAVFRALEGPAPGFGVTEVGLSNPRDSKDLGDSKSGGEPPVVAAVPQAGDPSLVLLRRIGAGDPADLDAYRAAGGYLALRQAVAMGPAAVIREVTDSGLAGRGGAAFPAGRKWEAVAREPVRPHELVCNADESEPGTFKDRVLMEGDPYAVLEAMTIAGYATGAERGWLYIRGEYPRALHTLERAITAARERGFLGADVMGLGFAFDVEIRRGAGAYICGEETAIFNSIEGYRGEPRSKPPFPTQVGLFGRPTLVNNVETLVNVLPILTGGAAAYRAVGTERSTGPKLFATSGRVRRPGVYEVPFGTSLGDLIELAGGVPPGHELRAVLMGGAAGAFVGPDDLDMPLSFEGAAAAGATLGSGVVMVLDETVDLIPFLVRIAAFFRDESCGQCVPCRVGTVRQEEALRRLAANGHGSANGSRNDGDLDLLADVGRAMRDASICGLGQTAWNAIESAIGRLRVFQ